MGRALRHRPRAPPPVPPRLGAAQASTTGVATMLGLLWEGWPPWRRPHAASSASSHGGNTDLDPFFRSLRICTRLLELELTSAGSCLRSPASSRASSGNSTSRTTPSPAPSRRQTSLPIAYAGERPPSVPPICRFGGKIWGEKRDAGSCGLCKINLGQLDVVEGKDYVGEAAQELELNLSWRRRKERGCEEDEQRCQRNADGRRWDLREKGDFAVDLASLQKYPHKSM